MSLPTPETTLTADGVTYPAGNGLIQHIEHTTPMDYYGIGLEKMTLTNKEGKAVEEERTVAFIYTGQPGKTIALDLTGDKKAEEKIGKLKAGFEQWSQTGDTVAFAKFLKQDIKIPDPLKEMEQKLNDGRTHFQQLLKNMEQVHTAPDNQITAKISRPFTRTKDTSR